MSTFTTERWVSTAPYLKLVVEEKSSNATSVVYTLKLYYVADYPASTGGTKKSWTVTFGGSTAKNSYDINGKTGTHLVWQNLNGIRVDKGVTASKVSVSVSMAFNLTWSGKYGGTKSGSGTISVPALSSYKISYNANGGSGAPGSQTKWAGTDIKLSSAKPTRTGYTFQGWATSASGGVAYAAGANYTANASVTLYAVWKINTWTVSYNANGGSGAPGSQTKTYGVTLKLSSTKPTRTNYTFKGWATSASGGVAYAAGANYTANAGATLYAVWELSYRPPLIENMSVQRCTADGTPAEDGTYANVTFRWSSEKTVSSIKIEWKLSTNATFGNPTNVSASGTSGNVSVVIGGGQFNIDLSYDIQVVISDTTGSSNVSRNLGTIRYIIDILKGGNGIAFGKAATVNGLFDVAYTASFDKPATFKDWVTINKDLHVKGNLKDKWGYFNTNGMSVYNGSNQIDPNTTLDHIILTNKNTPAPGGNQFMYIHTYFYSTKSTTAARMQVAYPYAANGSQYHRYYYNGAWTTWRRHANADEFDDYLVQVLFDQDNISIAANGVANLNIPISKSGYKIVGVTGINLSNASSSGVGVGSANLIQFYANTGSTTVKVYVTNKATGAIKIRVRGNALFFKLPT